MRQYILSDNAIAAIDYASHHPVFNLINPEGWRIIFQHHLNHELDLNFYTNSYPRGKRKPGTRTILSTYFDEQSPDLALYHVLQDYIGQNNAGHINETGLLPPGERRLGSQARCILSEIDNRCVLDFGAGLKRKQAIFLVRPLSAGPLEVKVGEKTA